MERDLVGGRRRKSNARCCGRICECERKKDVRHVDGEGSEDDGRGRRARRRSPAAIGSDSNVIENTQDVVVEGAEEDPSDEDDTD